MAGRERRRRHARPAAARLRISVTDRCNFRCPYCMPAELFGERYAFLPQPEILTLRGDRAPRAALRRGSAPRSCASPAASRCCAPSCPSWSAMLAAIPGVADLALTTNGVPAPAARRAARARGPAPHDGDLDSHDEDVFLRMSGGYSSPARVLAGIAAAERAGLAPIKLNCVVQRGVNDHTARRARAPLPRHRPRRALHRVHGRRHPERLGAGAGGAGARDRRAHRRRAAARAGRARTTAARWPALALQRRRAARSASSRRVSQPVLRRLHARAPHAPRAPSSPACSRHGHRPQAARCARGASDDELRALLARVWRARTDRYSELRAA